MDLIRQWALALCMACVSTGILQHLSSKTERFSVIKLVLTLYILVTAFTPLQALRYPETRYLSELPAVAQADTAVDADVLVLERAQQNLADALYESCDAAGSPLSAVHVTLKRTATGIAVQQIMFTPKDTTQCMAAEATIRSAVGADVNITQYSAPLLRKAVGEDESP